MRAVAGFAASVVLAAALAALLPWSLGVVSVHVRTIGWTAAMFAIGALVLASRLQASGARRAGRAEGLVVVVTVLVLCALWHAGGGMRAPILLAPLLAFAFGLGVLRGRGVALAVASGAVVLATLVVVVESRNLRQEVLVQGPRSDRWLAALPNVAPPEVSVAPDSEALVSMLLWLALGLPAFAWIGAGLGRRLRERAGLEQTREALAAGGPQSALLDAVPMPLVLVSRDGEVWWRNPAFDRRFVFVEGDLVGRPLADCLGLPEWAALSGALEGGTVELPASPVEVDGERRLARIVAQPLEAAQGLGVLLLIQDVTEAARLKEALDAGPPVAVTDRAGVVVYANAEGRRALAERAGGAAAGSELVSVPVKTAAGAVTVHLPARPGETTRS